MTSRRTRVITRAARRVVPTVRTRRTTVTVAPRFAASATETRTKVRQAAEHAHHRGLRTSESATGKKHCVARPSNGRGNGERHHLTEQTFNLPTPSTHEFSPSTRMRSSRCNARLMPPPVRTPPRAKPTNSLKFSSFPVVSTSGGRAAKRLLTRFRAGNCPQRPPESVVP